MKIHLPRHFQVWLASLLFVVLPCQAVALSSQAVFERIRPSVVEVLTKTKGNQGVAAAASGFLAQHKDWIVTNYHAVTEVIFEPEENDLIVVTQHQQKIPAQVIAADVRQDLAILKLSQPLTAPVLSLREQFPAKGE